MPLNFKQSPIIGMIHLAGKDPVKIAMEEISIMSNNGISGCIVENYHNTNNVVIDVLKELLHNRPDNFEIGINILPNDYFEAFTNADKYNASFIQLDYIAGTYDNRTKNGIELNKSTYLRIRDHFPKVKVLGGVWPKYYIPSINSILENDLKDGIDRTDAIVVTGAGTGKETPLGKIKKFREIILNHPLIVGAGVNINNVKEQLKFADGAIVGSAFKPNGDTTKQMEEGLIKLFMKNLINEL